MEEKQIALRPSYWASVSGGKDSLFMLKLILSNPDKYPLNGVVHFELETDYPFIKNVIDYMESECRKHRIPFFRFSPRSFWIDLYRKYGYPSRVARWCNNIYKLDAAKQLKEFLNLSGQYPVSYIGYCADEKKRFRLERVVAGIERYPLAENKIEEETILNWAKEQPIFNNYYKSNRRCGCMGCPMASKIEMAYLYKYYPENFEMICRLAKNTEKAVEIKKGKKISVWGGNPKYNTEYIEAIVKTKWIKILNEKENEYDKRNAE